MRIMKRMHGRGLVVLVALGLTAAVTAIAPLASAEDPPATNDWRIGYDQEFDNQLNVFAAQFSSDYFVFTEVYDLLLNFKLADNSPDLENSPAQSFESTPDGKVWTYKLRPNVKWADGQPFTADDVVWTLQTVVDTADDPGNVLSGYLPTPEKIEKVDPLTVKITLTDPNVRMSSLYIPILPKHIWDKVDPKKIKEFDPFTEITDATTGAKKKAIIGTGPYMLTKLDKKGTTIFERNPYFYGPKGEIDRILMVKYGDKDPQLRDIKLNKLDAILSGQPKWAKAEAANKDITVWSYPGPGFSEIAFNSCTGAAESLCTGAGKDVKKAVVQDPAIRHALYYALNRPEVMKTVLQDQGTVGNGLISPYYAKYYADFSKDPEVGYTYDPAKAKELLAAGGWNCPAGGICSKGGVNASFELLVRQNNQDDQNAAQRYAADAKAVGVDMKLAIVSEDQINERIYATSPTDPNKYEPTYDAFYWGWGGDNDSPAFNLDVLVCGSSWQDSMYCNPAYDKLVADSLKELDFAKRVALMHEAEKLALKDAPYLITDHANSIAVTRNDTWTGYVAQPETSGAPFSYSWLQLQLIKKEQSGGGSSNTGVIVAVVGGLVALVAIGAFAMRRRDRAEPVELEQD
ncbi:MAG: peptide/nickel transport system substrate-binding protein [Gaiellaceae bacterium]|nr:peptide/nickel transport system substrate-binding protein [Gaiellaceae bacterium]